MTAYAVFFVLINNTLFLYIFMENTEIINQIKGEADKFCTEYPQLMRYEQAIVYFASRHYPDAVTIIQENYKEFDCYYNKNHIDIFLEKLGHLINPDSKTKKYRVECFAKFRYTTTVEAEDENMAKKIAESLIEEDMNPSNFEYYCTLPDSIAKECYDK